jgi:hypothetical protein
MQVFPADTLNDGHRCGREPSPDVQAGTLTEEIHTSIQINAAS